MIQQWQRLKAEHRDELLFFRLGDFYELFFEDAQIGAKELEITLTGRDAGALGRVPMCGVPYHAAEQYLAKLIARGYRVAICEQVEDPREAKGLVEREVVRVVTPGTLTEQALLPDDEHNFLAAVSVSATKTTAALAVADLSTGHFSVQEWHGARAFEEACQELARWQIRELVLPEDLFDRNERRLREIVPNLTVRPEEWFVYKHCYHAICTHFEVEDLRGFALEGVHEAVCAAGALLRYAEYAQRRVTRQFSGLQLRRGGEDMGLDPAVWRGLELTRRQRGDRAGTLLAVLDETVTAMGARLLKQWVERPLVVAEQIQARLDAVESLVHDPVRLERLRRALRRVYDLERLAVRVAAETASPRDLMALRSTLQALPEVRDTLPAGGLWAALQHGVGDFDDLCRQLGEALEDDLPAQVSEGGVIRPGWNAELDRLRALQASGQEWIARLEQKERAGTGIKSLKIGYNKVFGYYLEVTKANQAAVPDYYIRKQTLASVERFVTPELKEREEEILTAAERARSLEEALFRQVRAQAATHVKRLQQAALALATCDVLASLADVASKHGYVKPTLTGGRELVLEDLRHPVLDQQLGRQYVPSSLRMDGAAERLMIITGPNMAGKSTFARAVALAVIMAQLGSFVPASDARIGLVDRVWVRIGAGDDLAGGQSTFMVEMNEVAQILHGATANSLVVLDEVGRGTSTYDGLSIAWAVAEDLHTRVAARTLLTTHYQELTQLESRFSGVRNLTVAVKEQGEKVVFLREVIPGTADRSYGIHVARLAGLPRHVVQRAREILAGLEPKRQEDDRQLLLFAPILGHATLAPEVAATAEPESELFRILRAVDPDHLSPKEALDLVYRLVQILPEE